MSTFRAALITLALILIAGVISAVPAAAAPPPFVHPGVLVNNAQLDFVKAKLTANAEPWTAAYNQSKTARQRYASGSGGLLSDPAYVPKPIARVECVSDQASALNKGCADVLNDAHAAYWHALNWRYKGNRASAEKAVEIMNAWSAVHTSFRFEYNQYREALLVGSWAGAVFPRAAEIMRYSGYTPAAGKPAFNVTKFRSMLNTAYVPLISPQKGTTANWLMAMADAEVSIGVFDDNTTTYNKGIARFTRELPAMLYLTSDPPSYPHLAGLPQVPDDPGYDTAAEATTDKVRALWYTPTSFPSGQEQETCRDMAHTSMGFGSAFNVMETNRHQAGADLYTQNQARMVAGLNLNNGFIAQGIASGTTQPTGWTCGTRPMVIDINGANAWMLSNEIGYQHYAGRKGVSLPSTLTVVNTGRTKSYRSAFDLNWQTLTHAGTP
jgi:hypothetical protein